MRDSFLLEAQRTAANTEKRRQQRYSLIRDHARMLATAAPWECWGRRKAVELGLAYGDALTAPQRRALTAAADELIDTTLDELASSGDSDWSASSWLVGGLLPPRYALRYDGAFARK